MQLCILSGNFDPLNFVGVICKHSSVISLTETCIYIYIYIRLKIKPNSVRIRFQSCQIFVLPSTGFEPTPLIHCSTIRLALRPAPSTTSTPYIYICTRVYHNVTISLKKFFITNPLILEEQNSFEIIGTQAEQFSGMGNFAMTIWNGT